jgi:hypothetical protein
MYVSPTAQLCGRKGCWPTSTIAIQSSTRGDQLDSGSHSQQLCESAQAVCVGLRQNKHSCTLTCMHLGCYLSLAAPTRPPNSPTMEHSHPAPPAPSASTPTVFEAVGPPSETATVTVSGLACMACRLLATWCGKVWGRNRSCVSALVAPSSLRPPTWAATPPAPVGRASNRQQLATLCHCRAEQTGG